MNSLNNKNCGVRNSTIFMLVQFKKKHPEENFKPFIKKLNEMSNEDSMIQNRLHAYLAAVCLEKPTLMYFVSPENYEDPKEFFDSVYEMISGPKLAAM